MMDRYLGQVLKNWTAEKQPPGNLRARIMLMASSHTLPAEQPYDDFLTQEKYLRRSFNDLSPLTNLEHLRNSDLVWAFQLPLPVLRMV
jgi:hypothetical protein